MYICCMEKSAFNDTDASNSGKQTPPSSAANAKGLSFWGYFVRCLKNYPVFRGRARRRELCGFCLFSLIFCILTFLVSAAVWLAAEISWKFVFIPAALCWLALLLPLAAVSFRRIQDTGKNGRYLLYALIPYTLLMILEIMWWNIATPAWGHYEYPTVLGYAITLSILASVTATVTVIIWLCLNSQPGTNKYGDNPKGVDVHPAIAKRRT